MKIKVKSTYTQEQFAALFYDLFYYDMLSHVILDLLDDVVGDYHNAASKLHVGLSLQDRATMGRIKQRLTATMQDIHTLMAKAKADFHNGDDTVTYIADAINDFVRLFYPNADYTDDDRETLAVNVIRAFEECKKVKDKRKEAEQLIIDKYLTR